MQGSDPAVGAALGVLGLDPDADRGEVIHAYRRLAKANHPDVSNAPDAPGRFSTISAAYRRALAAAPQAESAQPPEFTEYPETWTVAATLFPPTSVVAPTRAAWAFGAARRCGPWIVAGPVHIAPSGQRLPTPGTGESSAGGGA
jgi:hypothetical protein